MGACGSTHFEPFSVFEHTWHQRLYRYNDHQYLSCTGLNVERDVSSLSDPVEGNNQSLSGMKEEVTGQDGASVKHEVRPCPHGSKVCCPINGRNHCKVKAAPWLAVDVSVSYRSVLLIFQSGLDRGLPWGLLQSKPQREALLLWTRGR